MRRPAMLHDSLRIAGALILLLSAMDGTVDAQVTIQQPVFQTFGGQFSVVVPDRGGALLGRVSRGRIGQSRFGFGPFSGSSYGRSSQSSSLSAHVYVMDLHEMDRQILDLAESRSRSLPSRGRPAVSDVGRRRVAIEDFHHLSPAFRAGTASRRSTRSIENGLRMSGRGTAAQSRAAASGSTESGSTASRTAPVGRALDPARAWRLGQESERDGNLSVARLHYRVAARYGSELARRRLRQLGETP